MPRSVQALLCTCLVWTALACLGVEPSPASQAQPDLPAVIVLKPARVYDGSSAKAEAGWVVVVRGKKIDQAGPEIKVNVPAGAKVIDLPGVTLLPGLIDAHTHLLLHPYDEAKWDDQVLKEPLALRV